MRHTKHICYNCQLPIEPDEPEVQVDPARLARVKEKVNSLTGAKIQSWKYDGMIRYQHADPQACYAAECKAAAW